MDSLTEREDHRVIPTSPPAAGTSAEVLFVDIDGTLIRTDLLHESLVLLSNQSIRLLLRVLLSLAHGRAAFKKAVTEAVSLEIRHLPFRTEVLDFVAEQRSHGRKIILATAADSTWAQILADKLGLFDGILASDGVHNLKGSDKLEAIQRFCREQRYAQFDYLGDSYDDLPIWREARGVYIVAPSASLMTEVREFAEPAGVFGTWKSPIRSVLSAFRPQQWLKNILVFVPLVASHKVFTLPLAKAAAIAFVCFCFCTSAVYVLNDLADISADRRHPIKRKRPFASGALPVSWGLPLAIGLLILGFALSGLTLPAGFSVALAVYFVTTCVYSFHAKRIAMLDVLMLAGLYTIRVFAGGTAMAIRDLRVAGGVLHVSVRFACLCKALRGTGETVSRQRNGGGRAGLSRIRYHANRGYGVCKRLYRRSCIGSICKWRTDEDAVQQSVAAFVDLPSTDVLDQ